MDRYMRFNTIRREGGKINMLKLYLISVIIWLVILLAANKITVQICKTKNINYKKYVKNKTTKINYFVVSLIPIFRVFVWGVLIWLIAADETQLDKLFNKTKEN